MHELSHLNVNLVLKGIEMVAQSLFKTENEYKAAVERTIELFDAQPGTAEFDELELLLVLVKDYEDKHYQIPEPEKIRTIEMIDSSGYSVDAYTLKINSMTFELDKMNAIGIRKKLKELTDSIKAAQS